MTYVWVLLGAFFALGWMWLYYVGIMGLKEQRETAPLPTKVLGYPVAAIGLVLNFFFNGIVGTVFFVDIPREIGLTRRCQRYIRNGGGWGPDWLTRWRVWLARWICRNYLDPFDPRGRHC